MEIQINGEKREFSVDLTVEDLILALDLQPARVAIELNRSVVRRNQWAETTLHEGDRVEIVHFVGGGSDIMQSVPGANRGPRAGIPRGVVVATGEQLWQSDCCNQSRPGRYRSRY